MSILLKCVSLAEADDAPSGYDARLCRRKFGKKRLDPRRTWVNVNAGISETNFTGSERYGAMSNEKDKPEDKKGSGADGNIVTDAVAEAALAGGLDLVVSAAKSAVEGGAQLAGQVAKGAGEATEAAAEVAGAALEVAGNVAEGAVEIAGEVLSNIDIG